MRILFLNSIETETYGGMEEWIKLTAGGLCQRGHKITVAGRAGSEYLRRVKLAEKDLDILGLNISGDFDPIVISQLFRFLRKNEIELIVANFNKDIRLGGLAAGFVSRCKVVWSVGINITKDNWVHRFLTPRLIDGVIVPSLYLKNEITSPGYIDERLVDVIPIGISNGLPVISKQEAAKMLREKYNIPSDSIIAVTVGRFVPQKGHIYLIEAANDILKRQPQIKFIFLGNGPLEQELKNRISELNLAQYITFAGMLDDINPILQGADLMIHPSIEEPFGIALLEGMRTGLPIVASRVGGIPEVVEAGCTANLVEPHNPKALAEGVINLLASPEKIIEFGHAGKERWNNRFRLETMIDKVELYLSSLLKS